MNIVCTTDSHYITYLGVMLQSVCTNNTEHINFFVIIDRDVPSHLQNYLLSITSSHDVTIQFLTININSEHFPTREAGQPSHISKAAYYRLFLSSVLSPNIDKVIYLDSDIINVSSLRPLWEFDIENYAVGAVPDMDEGNLNIYRRLKYPPKLGYFNSGVLLVNLKYWREHNIEQRFLDFWRNHPERVLYHDQDILNYVLKDEKKLLPIKYNVQEPVLHQIVNVSWEYDKEIEDAINNPIIIHYTTSDKPWIKGCKHPWKDAFIHYYGTSKKLEKRKRNISLYKRLRNIAVKIGILDPAFRYRNDIRKF